MTIDQQIDANYSRRERGYDRYLDRIEQRELRAAEQIGELCRDGRTVYYVWPSGGKYREGNWIDLVAFLIRNNYA